jgi:hypothetical protein
MHRDEQIRLIAYRIWEAFGRPEGRDEENWLEAEAVWEETQKNLKVWLTAATPVLFGSVLYYEYVTNSIQISHGLVFVVATILAIVYLWSVRFKNGVIWLTDLLGLEGHFSIWVYEVGFVGGLFLSLYLLLGGPQNVVPPILQFSIIPVTATLGGLVIAGANYYSGTDIKRRVELLRVAQKFIVATIAFIFFAVLTWLASLGGPIDPNQFGTEWVKSFFFWVSAILFVLAAIIFVIGMVELAMSLKNLKK